MALMSAEATGQAGMSSCSRSSSSSQHGGLEHPGDQRREGASHISGFGEQMLGEKDQKAKVTPRELLLRLEQLPNASDTSSSNAAAAASKRRLADLNARTVQQVNALTVKRIKGHDSKLLQCSQDKQQQQHGVVKGQQLVSVPETPAEGLAVVQYLKWTMEALTDKHMAEIER
jgi:hypothetical protein